MKKYSIQCQSDIEQSLKSHMTLMYLGEQDDEIMNKIRFPALFFHLSNAVKWPQVARIDEHKLFGENKDVPVYTLAKTNNLLLARAITETFIYDNNIEPQTNFTRFEPHVSLLKPSQGNRPWGSLLYFPHIVSWE